MNDVDLIGIGIILTLLFWPWEERADVTIGPPTNYGHGPLQIPSEPSTYQPNTEYYFWESGGGTEAIHGSMGL